MAEDSKKPGPIKALFLLVAAGVLYLVQQFTGLDLFNKKPADETTAGGGTAVETPADPKPGAGVGDKEISFPSPGDKNKTKPGTDKPKQPDKKKPAPPKQGSQPDQPNDNGYATVKKLFDAGTSDAWIECGGEVVHILPTDTYGKKHQQFLVEVRNKSGAKVTLKIAHNIELADPVPIQKGDFVGMKGEYEWNDKGGVLHWTHHNPSPNPIKPGGWIDHKGKRYE